MRMLARVAVATALLVPAGAMIATQSANAAPNAGTSCKTQAGVANISPGLETTPRANTITSTTTISGCVGGGVTGGTSKSVVKLPSTSSCSSLTKVGTMTLTETVTWNTKVTSTISGTEKSNYPAFEEATITGKVTAGLFKGLNVTTTVKFSLSKGSCTNASPLTQLKITGIKPFVV